MARRCRRDAVTAAAVVLALLVAACGAGGDISVVALTATPSATTSATAAPGAVTSTPERPDDTTATRASPRMQLPKPPETLLTGVHLVSRWLADGDPDIANCLPELTEAWGFAETQGPRCAELDIDTDGEMELALVVTLPPRSGARPPGDIWLFDDPGAQHRLLGSARALVNDVLDGVAIAAVVDLTGDGHPELVVTAERCGASTCVTRIVIASGYRGRLEDLAPTGLEVASLESLGVGAAVGGSPPVLSLRGGTNEDRGAGPPRTAELRLSWDGVSFLAEEVPDPPAYLVQLIADGDALYASGAWGGARTLYLQAAGDRSLSDWKSVLGETPGRPELQAYALFRAALATLRVGDTPQALALLARAVSEHPATLHGAAAALYRAELQQGQSPPSACSTVEAFLQTRAAEHAAIWDYGYANPEHSIEESCR